MASDDELLDRFNQVIAGASLDDLRDLLPRLMGLGDQGRERPERRHPVWPEVVTYRLRIDVARAHPPIWRRLDIRSDVTLDLVHQIVQSAFGWWDSHLHRFSLGGDGFDAEAQLFLCPYDVEDGEDDGIPTSAVRLDETMHDAGDVLHYLYDYGDNWDLTLKLEKVLPRDAATAWAACVDGRRAAPPEDSGGIRDEAELAEVLDDPASFSVDEVNEALNEPYFVLRAAGLAPDLADVIRQFGATEFGPDLDARALTLVAESPEPSDAAKCTALRAVQWFLDRAAGDGIELTAAGYLKPADTVAAAALLPTVLEGIGKNNREANIPPLLGFREDLRRLGLIRKYKGRLVLTKAGDAARTDLGSLWRQMATRLVPDMRDRFGRLAAQLVLLHAASAPGESIPAERIAQMVTALGWRRSDGSALGRYDLSDMLVSGLPLLMNLSGSDDREAMWRGAHPIGAVASALARDALLS